MPTPQAAARRNAIKQLRNFMSAVVLINMVLLVILAVGSYTNHMDLRNSNVTQCKIGGKTARYLADSWQAAYQARYSAWLQSHSEIDLKAARTYKITINRLRLRE